MSSIIDKQEFLARIEVEQALIDCKFILTMMEREQSLGGWQADWRGQLRLAQHDLEMARKRYKSHFTNTP